MYFGYIFSVERVLILLHIYDKLFAVATAKKSFGIGGGKKSRVILEAHCKLSRFDNLEGDYSLISSEVKEVM